MLILPNQHGLETFMGTKWNDKKSNGSAEAEQNFTHTYTHRTDLRMAYWFVITPAVAFQFLLTSRGNSTELFITNVTTTAARVCVPACRCSFAASSKALSVRDMFACTYKTQVEVCVATRRVCVRRTPTTHPAGSFREGSDEHRTIIVSNRENRKEESSLDGDRDGKRKAVIKQDPESKRNKEIERLGKYQVSQTREKQLERAAEKKRHDAGESGDKQENSVNSTFTI